MLYQLRKRELESARPEAGKEQTLD
jgi:hypothetical protein